MQAERDAIECELKSATIDMKEVFLNALAQDGSISEAAISTESLGRVFGPLQKQVSSKQSFVLYSLYLLIRLLYLTEKWFDNTG